MGNDIIEHSNSMDEDSDAPEEVSLNVVKHQADSLRKNERENQLRLAAEAKRKRKQRAEKTESLASARKKEQRATEDHESEELQSGQDVLSKAKQVGMLPESIVKFLAEREEASHTSSEEMFENMLSLSKSKRKETNILDKKNRVHLVLLNDDSKSCHVKNAKDFLQSRQSRVRRSASMVNNAKRSCLLLSKQGVLQ